jgi:hypothetical protein
MPKTGSPYQNRKNALDRLKKAQNILTEGRSELATAQAKIERSQAIITESADTLRKTWPGEKTSS